VARWLLALGALGVARPALAADPLAYVRSSSHHERDAKGAPYHPIHLLDDKPDTIWCEGAEGLGEGEEVWMFFKRAQKVDRVVVQPTPKTGRLIERITISDGRNTVPIDLTGGPVEQTFATPMRGEKYTIAIDRVGGPNSSGAAVGPSVACIGDVMLYFRKSAFGGKAKPASFTYDAAKDRILGAWNGEPLGAPEKSLTFTIDGTWTWRYDPLMGRGNKKVSGQYRFRTGRLLMRKGESGRWSDMRFEYRRVNVNPNDPGAPLGDYSVLSFNEALGKELAGEYNDAVF
jgi:hypothetical protein